MIHKILCHMDSQSWEDIEPIPKSIGGFNLWVSGHVSLWIESLLMEVDDNSYSQ